MLVRSLWLLGVLVSLAPAAEPAKVGLSAGNFSLKDTHGKAHALADLKDRKAVVVVFLGTECPINNAFLPVLVELHREYGAKGVQFLAINSNRHDSPDRVAA